MAGSALCLPVQRRGGGHVCRGSEPLRPGPLSFLFSYQRPLTYQFQISQEQRETETTDGKGIFFLSCLFFPPLARLTECLHPSQFTEESNYSSRLGLKQQRQISTWQPSDINLLICNRAPKLIKSLMRQSTGKFCPTNVPVIYFENLPSFYWI